MSFQSPAFNRLLLGLSLLLLTACSATNLRDVWQNPEFKRDQLNQVLVVDLTAAPTRRMVFEDEFVHELGKKGIKAQPSYKYLGQDVPDKDKIIKFAKNNDYKYFLVTYVANEEIEKTRIPPTVTNYVVGGYPYGVYPGYYYPYFNSFWGPGAGASVSTIITPGFIDQTVNTIMVTSIYSVETLQILWSGRTSTFEGESQPASYIADQIANQVYQHIKN
ncbi:Uncharacterised protein [BD1-7 clade bacterium]|uniref:DUF4136 domain-containing protein n=1 Tax=BD1-7 clade bacterium TaxID=2029982 RepID=A0A5S9PN26_9GAMM|nr:Uncharacterised protein [BD1-7 clade bacterium]CAA0105334.1 Uncharacterised protein [BD1-7 clade bacterium]